MQVHNIVNPVFIVTKQTTKSTYNKRSEYYELTVGIGGKYLKSKPYIDIVMLE